MKISNERNSLDNQIECEGTLQTGILWFQLKLKPNEDYSKFVDK